MGKKINKPLFSVGGIVLSALLLTFCQAPFDQAWMAWIAWVPFMLVCRPEARTGRLCLLAYFLWMVYWLGNLYWLAPLTEPGYLVFGVVQALYAPLLIVCFLFVRRRKISLIIAAPLILIGAEAWQSKLFTGFSWYFLAHSQYENLPLIQICDIFGQLGVSVVIAMVNGLIADLILSRNGKKLLQKTNLVRIAVAGLVLGSVLKYGFHQLEIADQFLSEGPLVGSVQTNVPSHVKESAENGPDILDGMIELSDQCFKAGAVMVAWPETMVLAPMNDSYLTTLSRHNMNDADSLQYHRQISEHAKKNNGYVLFGSHTVDLGIKNNEYVIKDQYNSAFYYNRLGAQEPARYDKIHLVPFGEYIPFRNRAPWIYNIILGLSPYDYNYNLTPGGKYIYFGIEEDEQTYNFGVIICYEDTDPTICRKITYRGESYNKADFLVNLSNDGWYIFEKDGRMIPTVELPQRMAITVFRCIENRISVIRSVNTGISCLVDPAGRIRDDYIAGNLPQEAIERQAVEGWFVDRIPIDSRISFFTRHGRWLDTILGVSLLIIFPVSLLNLSKKKKKGPK